MTQAPGTALLPSGKDAPAMLAFLDSFKPTNRYSFLQPTPSIPSTSLWLAKDTLDSFAGQVGDEQQQRLREAGKKRKRGEQSGVAGGEILKIRKLHIDGFETGQVWQQARRIISSALLQSEETLRDLEASQALTPSAPDSSSSAKVLEIDEDGFEVDSDNESILVDDSEDLTGSGAESDGEDVSQSGEENPEVEEDGEEGTSEDDEGEDEQETDLVQPNGVYVEDSNGLNDGFFSIDDFNKQTQWLEDQDARADPKTDALSDEEGLDWHADPMTVLPNKGQASTKKTEIDDGWESDVDGDEFNDDEDGDDDGPAPFGNADLFAPEGDGEDDNGPSLEEGLAMDLTANDIFYKDFFAPPPKKGKRGSKPFQATGRRPQRPDNDEIERAMAKVRRDLFEDNSDGSDSDDALSDVSAGDPRSRRSAHERRQAKLLEEIRKLEAAAVKEKDWAMSGETSGAARPMNSLLEEDLDFEHVGKPVPVATQEVSESIEEMVKRRILDQQFDEVPRRLPGSLGEANGARRGLVDIDDKKAERGLAQLYEEEHVKTHNPDTYVSAADDKLRAEELEVESLWKDVAARLDALSSWHYRPKPAAPALRVVVDAPAIAMEDAQPAAAQGVAGGGASTLAPQEVYRAGAAGAAEKGEVVPRTGLPVARQEMTREDRARRRRRAKERGRKAGADARAAPVGKKAQERKDTVAQLRKGGVKVINRRGEVLDVDGNKVREAKAVSSGSYKL